MKVPIDEVAVIDLDASVLWAYERRIDGEQRRERHDHGPAEGHRAAHCRDESSPYWRTGYNLAYAEKWRDRPKTA